jgi:hypothetical protein
MYFSQCILLQRSLSNPRLQVLLIDIIARDKVCNAIITCLMQHKKNSFLDLEVGQRGYETSSFFCYLIEHDVAKPISDCKVKIIASISSIP